VSALTLIYSALAFDDDESNSNPTQSPINWAKTLKNLDFDNPSTQSQPIDPMGTVTLFNGVRSTSIDGTTQFSIALSALDSSRYRITSTSGTAPAFRTDRALVISAIALALVVNANQSVTVTAGSGTPFGAVQVGDTVFIPGVSTGDSASPFNALNEGYWTVLSASTTILVLSRAAGTVFAGFTQTITTGANVYFQAFSTAGVQVGDTVQISAGFSAPAQHSYEVVAVNPIWFEFESTAPLGAQTGVIPTATGLSFYTLAKNFLAVESDQEVVLRFNGDTSDFNRLEPIVPGDRNFPGMLMKLGPVWRLDIVNKSSAVANTVVLSAE
jgi:hypothetical protein